MQHQQISKSVNELQFNVSQLLKETTGATRGYKINIETIEQLDESVALVAPLQGTVDFLRTGQDILVTGLLKTTIEKPCGRCLNTFATPVTIEMEELFYPTLDLMTGGNLPPPPDADEANRINEQHTLDLSEVVRQAILLEIEGLRYCRSDCQGLCPHCGQDRSSNPCTCEDNATDLRWAGLQAFQIEE